MADPYIDNQKKIIRKHIVRTLPGYLLAYFLLLLIAATLIYAMDPPPQTWKTDEITFVDAQFRSKQKTLSRYASSGYELTDQNGNRYWAGSELSWQELGKPYTVKYFMRGGYRALAAVTCADAVIISENEKIASWKQTTGELSLLLLICVFFIVISSRSLIRSLHAPQIQECRKRIRMHNAKVNRRALEKHSK